MAAKTLTEEQKKALASLRSLSGAADAARREQYKLFRSTRKAIREYLQKQPATVPEIADALKLPRDQAFWHVAGMRKYGLVRDEPGEEGDYVRYALVSEPQAEPAGH